MIATAEQVLIKRVRPEEPRKAEPLAAAVSSVIKRARSEEPREAKPSGAAMYSARLALCVIFAFVFYTLIGFVPELAKRSPQHVALLDRTVPHKTLAIHANYPTAAAWLAFRLHYYYAAISFLSDAIQEHPRDTRAYERRALAYWAIGQRSFAANDFQRALGINPKETTALRNLAWLISTSPNLSPGDAKRAIEFAQRACQLTSWRDADLIATLAAAYAASGDFRKAVATQRRVLAILGDREVVSGRLDYIEHKTYPATVIPASW